MMDTYFVTYGRGALSFVKKDLIILNNKFNSDNNSVINFFDDKFVEGKLLFDTTIHISNLINLKTIERCFLNILFLKFDSNKEVEECFITKKIAESIKDNFFSDDSISYIIKQFEKQNSTNEAEAESKRNCQSFKVRINCKLTGKWKRNFNLKSSIIKIIIDRLKQMNGHVELVDNTCLSASYDIEISCHISDYCVALGVPISRRPLSNRIHIKNTGLRSTICAIMLQLADINSNNQFILDPFCGKSTIFTEFFGTHKDYSHFFIGIDCDLGQIESSMDNIQNNSSKINFINFKSSPCNNIPLKDNSIDIIITDLPFGKNHIQQGFFQPETFYLKIINEFDRLITRKSDSKIVLLVSGNEFNLFEDCLEKLNEKDCELSIKEKHIISLGETNAYIYKLS
jgi:tRNA G10  N-methylase Trm11